MRRIIVGSQLDIPGKVLVNTIESLKLEIGLCELIGGLGETGIDLHSIGKLNGRLAVSAPGEITLAALKILLFAHIGITRAAREQSSGERTDQQQTDKPGTTHVHFSNCGAECADRFPAPGTVNHTAPKPAGGSYRGPRGSSECVNTDFSSARDVVVQQRSDITGKGKKTLLCRLRRFARIHGSRDPR